MVDLEPEAALKRCSESIQKIYRTPIPKTMQKKNHFGMGALL